MSEFDKNERNEQQEQADASVEMTEEVSEEPTEANQDDAIEAEATVEKEDSLKKNTLSFAKEFVDYVEMFVLAVCFVILLFSFAFRLCTVDGASMENTLLEGEKLVVSDLFYEPQVGDIVVFHQTGVLNEPVVKRVIARGGETVSLAYTYDTMTVTVTAVDGTVRVMEEPYIKYEGYPLYLRPMTVTVPEGQLFVMGDNRNESKDSRHPDIGLVDERRILGKVILRVAPITRFGKVD